MTTAPATVPPEILSAILRNPDNPLFPCRIGVFCDTCGTTVSRDYLVSEEQTWPERLDVARTHLRAEGWQADQFGDFCPQHARQTAPRTALEAAQQLAVAGHHSHLHAEGQSRCISGHCPPASRIDPR